VRSLKPGLASGALLLALGLQSACASATFQVDTNQGCWSIASGGNSLTNLSIRLDGEPLLDGATESGAAWQKTVKGLRVSCAFKVISNAWVEVRVGIINPGNQPVNISSLEYFSTDCSHALAGIAPEALRFYHEHALYGADRSVDGEAHYTSVLYGAQNGSAWVIAYRPPQLWTSMISKRGTRLRSFVDFYGRPFPLAPGESVEFDPLLLSAEFKATQGLLAYGQFYQSRISPQAATGHGGFNTWDYYRGEIGAQRLTSTLDALSAWNQERHLLKYFILDDGWAPDRGDWRFNLKKFPQGQTGWATQVEKVGMIPGVWLSPFWGNKQVIQEKGLTLYRDDPQVAFRYQLDPSCPKVREYVFERCRDLRRSGYRYFKLDFLNIAFDHYREKPFAYSKFPPERVVRDFLLGIREAVGNDSFLLGCSTTIAPCAGVCDGARLYSDITENWDVATKIYRMLCHRFWMNGTLFLADPDFFVGRGPNLLLPGASPGFALETGARQYQGFDARLAHSWACMIFALGGQVVWGDEPRAVKPEVWHLLEVLLREAPGQPGVPLDWTSESLCTKWVRRNAGQVYVILINASREPRVITVGKAEVHELEQATAATEIFTGEKIALKTGEIQVSLPAGASLCYRIEPHP